MKKLVEKVILAAVEAGQDGDVQVVLRVPASFRDRLAREGAVLGEVTGSKISYGAVVMHCFEERDKLRTQLALTERLKEDPDSRPDA